MPYEVELKFATPDPAAVRRQLVALGATNVSTETEVDVYFQHPVRSFAQTDEALRVRQTDSQVFITYKGPKIDSTTKTRTEIDVPVCVPAGPAGGPASAASNAVQAAASELIALLEHLGFRPVREVRKRRELLHVPWQGATVKVSLDAVAGLGDFLELELSAEPAELEQSRQLIVDLAQRLNLVASERRSYLELLMAKDSAAARPASVREDSAHLAPGDSPGAKWVAENPADSEDWSET